MDIGLWEVSATLSIGLLKTSHFKSVLALFKNRPSRKSRDFLDGLSLLVYHMCLVIIVANTQELIHGINEETMEIPPAMLRNFKKPLFWIGNTSEAGAYFFYKVKSGDGSGCEGDHHDPGCLKIMEDCWCQDTLNNQKHKADSDTGIVTSWAPPPRRKPGFAELVLGNRFPFKSYSTHSHGSLACEDLIKQNKEESRYSTRSMVLMNIATVTDRI
ncbi:hypothetical protein J6590_041159 [Homalodisca vitripennis]|nr:hypothetical protein J6590_041159 [Homalodisca vitripennis]